jgi:putative ABC transport system ATP-binding protein
MTLAAVASLDGRRRRGDAVPGPGTVRVAASLTGVTKLFATGGSEVKALNAVSLELRAGELLLLVGPSGCGKTTLLSVLAGLLDVDEGAVTVFGTRLDALDQRRKAAFRRDHIGFIFQQFNLVPTLTAAENVAIPLLIRGIAFDRAVATAREYLARVGLAERGDFAPGRLSGGQQQRVAIARALVSEPRLVVCDEPTASLDGETGRRVMETLRRAALAKDRAVVVVTHDSRIFEYGDRIAEMLDGRLVAVREAAATRP